MYAFQFIITELKFSYIGTVTAWHSSSGHQPNFAALNRGRHLCSTGRPSGWALAHISSFVYNPGLVYGNSSGFEVKVDMHQGSALSPLLFVIVMEAISREFTVALPWELLYAHDLAVIAETEEDLIKRLSEWKNNVENRGMTVNMNKTKVMISGERQKPVQKAARWLCGVCGRGVGSI